MPQTPSPLTKSQIYKSWCKHAKLSDAKIALALQLMGWDVSEGGVSNHYRRKKREDSEKGSEYFPALLQIIGKAGKNLNPPWLPPGNEIEEMQDQLRLNRQLRAKVLHVMRALGYPTRIETANETDIQENLSQNDYLADMPIAQTLFGRDQIISEMHQWISTGTRLIVLLGSGGIGKTSVAASLVKTAASVFTYRLWVSLQNPLPFEQFLEFLAVRLFDDPAQLQSTTVTTERLITRFIELSKQGYRCLIVLDNIETLLEVQITSSRFKAEYLLYQDFLTRFSGVVHSSCIIITTRQLPAGIARSEAYENAVRLIQLDGLAPEDVRELLRTRKLHKIDDDRLRQLVTLYNGNPFAIRVAMTYIQYKYGGVVERFLAEKVINNLDVFDLVREQWNILAWEEQTLLYWLAVEREPQAVEMLLSLGSQFNSEERVNQSLLLLVTGRALLEYTQDDRFTLPGMFLEFVTHELTVQLANAVLQNHPSWLSWFPLLMANRPAYIRQAQHAALLAPTVKQISDQSDQQRLTRNIKAALQELREIDGYGAATLFHLIEASELSYADFDFSNQILWSADFRTAQPHFTHFDHAVLKNCRFREDFGNLFCVTVHSGFVAFGTDTNEVRLYQIDGWQLKGIYRHEDYVRAVAFHPNGRWIASAGDDVLHIWDVLTGRTIYELHGHHDRIWSLDFSPDGQCLASCDDSGYVYLWQLGERHNLTPEQSLKLDQNAWCVRFHPQDSLVAIGSSDCYVHLWHFQDGSVYKLLSDGSVRSIDFHPDRRLMLVGTYLGDSKNGGSVVLFDISTTDQQNMLYNFTQHNRAVMDVLFSPKGDTFISVGNDGHVYIHDANQYKFIARLEGYGSRIWAAAFVDEYTLFTAGADWRLSRWSIEKRTCIETWQGFTNPLKAVAFSPDGQFIAVGGGDFTIAIWDWRQKSIVKRLVGHTDVVWSVAWHPTQPLLASCANDSCLRLWSLDVDQVEILRKDPGEFNLIRSCIFSPDGMKLAICDDGKGVNIWSLSEHRWLRRFSGQTHWLWRVAFNHDGSRIASVSEDGTAYIWGLDDNAPSTDVLAGHEAGLRSIAFSANGEFIATCGDDGTVGVWTVQDLASAPRTAANAILHHGYVAVRDVAFSPDNKLVASICEEGLLKVWQVAEPVARPLVAHAHANWGMALSFHPDGTKIASVGHDELVRVWNTQDLSLVCEMRYELPYQGASFLNVSGLTGEQKAGLKRFGADV